MKAPVVDKEVAKRCPSFFLVGLLLLDSFTLSPPPLKAYAKYILANFSSPFLDGCRLCLLPASLIVMK